MAILVEESVADALREFDGNMAAVARKFGVSRVAVWLFVEAREALKEIVAQEKERLVDDIEGAFIRNAKNGNVPAQIFFLKTQARHRGYSERLEVGGADGGPLQLNVVFELPQRQMDHADELDQLNSEQLLITGDIGQSNPAADE